MIHLRPCAICGINTGKFVCRNCGANVCEDHYDPATGLCDRCRIR
ncbi:MAG: hypothetical protein ABIB71_09065 [Candidatus Woesearchaeota archaeon]